MFSHHRYSLSRLLCTKHYAGQLDVAGSKIPLSPPASTVFLSEIKRRNRGAWWPGKPVKDSSAKGKAWSTKGLEKSEQAGRPEASGPGRKSHKTISESVWWSSPWTYFNCYWHRWWLLLFYLSLGPKHRQQKGVVCTAEVEHLGDTGLDVYGGWSPESWTLSGLQVKAGSKWRDNCRRSLTAWHGWRVCFIGVENVQRERGSHSYLLHFHTPSTQQPSQGTGCHQLLKSPSYVSHTHCPRSREEPSWVTTLRLALTAFILLSMAS